jgi:hypothetical protein
MLGATKVSRNGIISSIICVFTQESVRSNVGKRGVTFLSLSEPTSTNIWKSTKA